MTAALVWSRPGPSPTPALRGSAVGGHPSGCSGSREIAGTHRYAGAHARPQVPAVRLRPRGGSAGRAVVPWGCAPGPSVPVSPPCGGRRPGLRRSRVPGRPRPGVRGRLAYRRGVPARRGGASSPPGAAAAASAGPVPGGPASPGPRSPGRLVVAVGLRAPGPARGGRARRPPPARRALSVPPWVPPGRPLPGRPPTAWAAAAPPSPGRWCGGRQRPPWSVSAPGGVGLVLRPAWVLLRPWWALLPCCVAAGG